MLTGPKHVLKHTVQTIIDHESPCLQGLLTGSKWLSFRRSFYQRISDPNIQPWYIYISFLRPIRPHSALKVLMREIQLLTDTSRMSRNKASMIAAWYVAQWRLEPTRSLWNSWRKLQWSQGSRGVIYESENPSRVRYLVLTPDRDKIFLIVQSPSIKISISPGYFSQLSKPLSAPFPATPSKVLSRPSDLSSCRTDFQFPIEQQKIALHAGIVGAEKSNRRCHTKIRQHGDMQNNTAPNLYAAAFSINPHSSPSTHLRVNLIS